MNLVVKWTFALLCGLAPLALVGGSPQSQTHQFTGELPKTAHQHRAVEYDFDLKKESFNLFVPSAPAKNKKYGLVVFINPADAMGVPSTWFKALDRHHLLCIAAKRSGNSQPVRRRAGLAVLAALKLAESYDIDPDRIHISGFSGGARSACMTAYYHSEIFTGVIPICGVQFYKKVPWKRVPEDETYGHFSLDNKLVEKGNARLKFALVTGPGDFRYKHMKDIYELGFVKEKVKSTFIDVPGMGHVICSAAEFEKALQFIEGPSK